MVSKQVQQITLKARICWGTLYCRHAGECPIAFGIECFLFFTLIALPKTAFIVSPSWRFQPTNFPATNLPTSCIQLYVIFITACEGRHSVTFRRFRSNPCETMPYSLVHAAGGKNREGRFWEGCCGQIVVMSELRSWQFLVIATYLLQVANHLLKYIFSYWLCEPETTSSEFTCPFKGKPCATSTDGQRWLLRDSHPTSAWVGEVLMSAQAGWNMKRQKELARHCFVLLRYQSSRKAWSNAIGWGLPRQ